MIQAMKDSYAVERISEQLLHQLATERLSDVEAYWILWLLFHRVSKYQISVRAMFGDKFLLWKVFHVRCLRWILQFAHLKVIHLLKVIIRSSCNQPQLSSKFMYLQL